MQLYLASFTNRGTFSLGHTLTYTHNNIPLADTWNNDNPHHGKYVQHWLIMNHSSVSTSIPSSLQNIHIHIVTKRKMYIHTYACTYVACSYYPLYICICDRACKNQPREYRKITNLFRLCCIITYKLFVLTK